jgi:hypothetical protein
MVGDLVVKQCINQKGPSPIKSIEVPSIFKGLNKFGYTWDDFLAEYGWSFTELAYAYIDKQKIQFVRIREFQGSQFTVQDHLNGQY